MNEAFYILTIGDYSAYTLIGLYRGPVGLDPEEMAQWAREEWIGVYKSLKGRNTHPYIETCEHFKAMGLGENEENQKTNLIVRKYGLTEVNHIEVSI